MRVIAKEEGFYKGVLVKPMEEFEFDGEKCGKWFVPVDGDTEEEPTTPTQDTEEEPTRKEIMVQLDQAGVKYLANDNKATLLELLKDAVNKVSPGAPTGNKDLKDKTE